MMQSLIMRSPGIKSFRSNRRSCLHGSAVEWASAQQLKKVKVRAYTHISSSVAQSDLAVYDLCVSAHFFRFRQWKDMPRASLPRNTRRVLIGY